MYINIYIYILINIFLIALHIKYIIAKFAFCSLEQDDRIHMLQLQCSPSYLPFRFIFIVIIIIFMFCYIQASHELLTKLRRRFLIKCYATIRSKDPTKKIIISGQFFFTV